MISADELELLIQALKDESIDGEDRRNAAEVLGKIKDPKAFTPLIQYFKDPAQYNFNQRSLVRTLDELLRNRSAAEEAFVMIGEPAIQPLIQILENDDYRLSDAARALNGSVGFIRRGAVRALGRINGAQVIGSLIRALRDNDPGVQSEAEDQLRKNIFDKVLDSSLGDSLIQTLKDSDNEVRMRAEESRKISCTECFTEGTKQKNSIAVLVRRQYLGLCQHQGSFLKSLINSICCGQHFAELSFPEDVYLEILRSKKNNF